MRSSNPVMTGRIFEKAGGISAGAQSMTIHGTINKIGIMLLLVIAAAAYTWKMVMGVKNGAMSRDEYTDQYLRLMRSSYAAHADVWEAILTRERVTIVCFCRAGSFCHRYLLADYLAKLGAVYCGEKHLQRS